ncbi:Diacylglycerol kinase (EC [Olavius algarvensis associated proteobacterium Delta 3]|nr:Diacylglycerol kinase (EC [Olavius algarvensis associated proteobacterium Delta 3]CAB5167459.1 Diacylglycerol kinase (EC [Olavius algarvensis associated proteobacterium Delta 3]
MDQKPTSKTGVSRLRAALGHSLNGLRCAVRNEEAFRQEICIIAVLLVVLFFLPLSQVSKGLLFFATMGVLIVELLNSAIESVVDIASPEYHNLAKRAKDLGSAAVLVSLVLAGLLWLAAFFSLFIG